MLYKNLAVKDGKLTFCGYDMADVAAGQVADLPQRLKLAGEE